MKMISLTSFRNALNDQRGQVLPWAVLGMIVLLGMAGLTIDVGNAYVVRAQLQNCTNASALAAAGEVYNSSSTDNAVTYANQYSCGVPGNKNYNPRWGAITPTITPTCLTLLLPSGSSCTGAPNNAVRVKQTVRVPTYFMKLFGVNSLDVSSTATASMQGSAQSWNVAIILDATPSMNAKDPYCSDSSLTAEQCALTGIQTMLKGINPCNSGQASCDASSNMSNFRVSLFSFPNVTTGTVSNDYDCSGTPKAPTEQLYTLPAIPTSGSTSPYKPFAYTGTSAFTATYQITPPNVGKADANGFLSDYYDPTAATGLHADSILVKAVGNGSTKGCLTPPTGFSGGGGQTYFAGAIYAAQTALQAEQATVAALGIKSNNAIIFVSDGQANTAYNRYPQVTSTADSGGISVTYYKSTTTTKNLTGVHGTFGVYPDFHDDCQQAITAANNAKAAGTRMYGVAYGSEASGCSTDNSGNVVVSGTLNVPINSLADVIPCVVIENIASPGLTSSSPWYFYTDGSSVANGCKDSSHTSSNLNNIFEAITTTFTDPRLLPNDAQ